MSNNEMISRGKSSQWCITSWFLKMQNSKPEELQNTELERGPQSEHLHQGRTCFFKCEFDFPQFHLKNSIFLLWVNCNNMLSCAKPWVSEEQRCSKVSIIRRKRGIYLKIHLSPPLSLSVSWLPGEVQLIFSPLQWLGTLLQGQTGRGKRENWLVSQAPQLVRASKLIFSCTQSVIPFLSEKNPSAFLHLQELYICTLSWLKLHSLRGLISSDHVSKIRVRGLCYI